MRQRPGSSVFYDALPVGGSGRHAAQIRMRGTPAEGNVHAKTGSLEQGRASLSGYVTAGDGRLPDLQLLCNNWTVAAAATWIGVQDAIVADAASRAPR